MERKETGYTLIEILLVIAIVLTVGFLSLAFPVRMLRQAEINDAAEQLRGALTKARTYALSGKENSAWGVHYASPAITLFKGDSYSGRDRSFDEATQINEKVSISGLSEIVFRRPGGLPNTADFRVVIYRDNEEESFFLNSEGVAE